MGCRQGHGAGESIACGVQPRAARYGIHRAVQQSTARLPEQWRHVHPPPHLRLQRRHPVGQLLRFVAGDAIEPQRSVLPAGSRGSSSSSGGSCWVEPGTTGDDGQLRAHCMPSNSLGLGPHAVGAGGGASSWQPGEAHISHRSPLLPQPPVLPAALRCAGAVRLQAQAVPPLQHPAWDLRWLVLSFDPLALAVSASPRRCANSFNISSRCGAGSRQPRSAKSGHSANGILAHNSRAGLPAGSGTWDCRRSR